MTIVKLIQNYVVADAFYERGASIGNETVKECVSHNLIPVFDISKFGLAIKLGRHKERELKNMLIHFFFCLYPLGLTIKLN